MKTAAELNQWRVEVSRRIAEADAEEKAAFSAGDLATAADAADESDLLHKLAKILSWRVARLSKKEERDDD
jgi:hypothetical protein